MQASEQLTRRRFLPLRNLNQGIGMLGCLTYCLSQKPALLPLTPDICMFAADAHTLLEITDTQLANMLSPSRTAMAAETHVAIRRSCMDLLCACISWDEFR